MPTLEHISFSFFSSFTMLGGLSPSDAKYIASCRYWTPSFSHFEWISVGVTVPFYVTFSNYDRCRVYAHYRFYADKWQQRTVTKQLRCYTRMIIDRYCSLIPKPPWGEEGLVTLILNRGVTRKKLKSDNMFNIKGNLWFQKPHQT